MRIADLPLIHKGSGEDANAGTEWSWSTWFTRLSLNTPPPVGLRCANMATAISAALQGSGAVLARSLIARDALADGRLVRVLPKTWDMPSTKVHLVRWPGALAGDPRVKAFVSWLVDVAGARTRARPNC
jgi:LysR family transcriptional regulator, glycine cleavage system transcriptional activator